MVSIWRRSPASQAACMLQRKRQQTLRLRVRPDSRAAAGAVLVLGFIRRARLCRRCRGSRCSRHRSIPCRSARIRDRMLDRHRIHAAGPQVRGATLYTRSEGCVGAAGSAAVASCCAAARAAASSSVTGLTPHAHRHSRNGRQTIQTTCSRASGISLPETPAAAPKLVLRSGAPGPLSSTWSDQRPRGHTLDVRREGQNHQKGLNHQEGAESSRRAGRCLPVSGSRQLRKVMPT